MGVTKKSGKLLLESRINCVCKKPLRTCPIITFTSVCSPRDRTGKGRGKKGSGLYPELAAFRISDGCSPNVQEESARQVALLPVALAREELARRGLELDEKAVHRITVGLGVQMLATRTRDLRRFHSGDFPAGTDWAGKRIAVQIDGGRVRTRTVVQKSRVGKKRKRRKVRIEWREPKLVILYALDQRGRMDEKTRPVIDGTLRGPDALAELAAFHLHRHRLGAAEAKEVTFVADGARWIWSRVDWIAQRAGVKPERVWQVLDWCHAVHHLSLALEATWLNAAERKKRLGELRGLLKQGGANKLLLQLQSLQPLARDADRFERELRYFERHAEAGRLRYGVFRYRRQPMGSGAVESAIRRVINLRLKGNGIYWTADNAEAVIQLRSAILSGRWEETLMHTRESIARDRRTDWHWNPPTDLAQLNAPSEDDEDSPQTPRPQCKTSIAA